MSENKEKRQKAQTPKSRKGKGREFQKGIRETLISELGIHPADIHTRQMGSIGCDIVLAKEARDQFPWAVEAKKKETLNIWAALSQAKNNADKEKLKPLLIFKRNHSPTYVALELNDFLDLVIEKSNGE